MRAFSMGFVVLAALIGASMMLPVCPSAKRTPPAEVGRCIVTAGSIGAAIGGGLATVLLFTIRKVTKRRSK